MTSPLARDLYTPASVAACEKALRTIIARIGPWGARVILIGGLVPRYLIPVLSEGIRPHAGTTDLDIVIGISIEDEDAAVYRTLQQNLREAGFQPATASDGPRSYQWERRVDGVQVVLEFFCPAGQGKPGTLLRNPGDMVGSELSAIRLRGADLVARDYVVRTLSGEMLDKGGNRDNIDVRVSNLLPFLMLKGFAISQRHKDKDPYDLVWVLLAHPDGPAGAARMARQSPIVGSEEVAEAIRCIDRAFAGVDSEGPALYARVVLGLAGQRPEDDDEAGTLLRRDGHSAVQEFLEAWRAGDS